MPEEPAPTAPAEEPYDGEEVIIEELSPSNESNESSELRKSALRASKEKAGEFSYYYCQEEHKGFPADAVIRQEDPLKRADGLGPKKLEDEKVGKTLVMENVKWIDSMSFSDEGAHVKVYIEFPESLKDAEITSEFGRFSVELLARLPRATYGVRVREIEGWVLEHERKNGWAHEIVPEKCKHRLSSNGQRITLTLAKKDEKEKWYELTKKDIRSTFR